MDPSSPPSDAKRELDELRRRAYGPHPDIQADPAALARLKELEAARTALPPDSYTAIGEPAASADGAPLADSAWAASIAASPDPAAGIAPEVASSKSSPRSLWQRLTATRARRSWFVTGALVASIALACTLAWLVGPHPDATLHPIADEADGVVLAMLAHLGADDDHSSISGYQPYRGVEPWFLVDSQGFQCFMLIQRSGPTVDGANCVPPGVDLFADIVASPLSSDGWREGLPNGSIIRFHYRRDTVDVFLYPASEAD
jgi:hypothetical protein